jgi:hypothetical protein
MNNEPMNEDYLWDRSGAPDADVETLEALLAPMRYRPPRRRGGRWLWWAAPLAAAAGLAAFVLWPHPKSDWFVAGQALRLNQEITPQVETTMEDENTGVVKLQGGSRLKIEGARHFALKQGELHAFIWAPPGQFTVDTPVARAVDLGCEYTLRVDGDGTGLLSVATGWVAFQSEGRESFIPAGAACRTYARRGPGTPFAQDASAALRTAIDAFDQGNVGALNALVSAARKEDALTLWHLLARTQGEERGRVYDQMAKFLPLPARADVVRGDAKSLDAAWDALGYGNTEWWRNWKHQWETAR